MVTLNLWFHVILKAILPPVHILLDISTGLETCPSSVSQGNGYIRRCILIKLKEISSFYGRGRGHCFTLYTYGGVSEWLWPSWVMDGGRSSREVWQTWGSACLGKMGMNCWRFPVLQPNWSDLGHPLPHAHNDSSVRARVRTCSGNLPCLGGL